MPTDRFDFVRAELDRLKQADLLRRPVRVDSVQGPVVEIGGRQKVTFCSNDYLSLAGHPHLRRAVCDAVTRYGHGAAASRLISGTMKLHVELEARLAGLLQKPAALVFPSGWTANEGLIRTIAQKGDLLLLDRLDHASIIDAARAAEAQFRTYRRDRPDRLIKLLADGRFRRKFIITESIFSMDGDTADLAVLVELKNKYGAFLVVDEAHAFGCLGPAGAGLAEQMQLLDEVDIVVVTLSKALGSAGGAVAADRAVIDLLINKSRSFIYTTAPTVANCAAALAALDILRNEPQRRQRLHDNALYLRGRLKGLGLDTGASQSHVIPLMIGDRKKALDVSQRLFEVGFFIPAIRPPTVAPGTARLRISVQSGHTKQQMDALCEALKELIDESLLRSSSL